MIRSADNAPDHGCGPLGKTAHAVLAENLGGAPEEPALLLCHNTMPDPPFPMVGYIGTDYGAGQWAACGQDFTLFLGAMAQGLRGTEAPPPGSFGPEHHRLQRMLRHDAAALCFQAHAMAPEADPAAAALVANLSEGLLHPGDLEASPGARVVTVVWAADRADRGVIAFVPAGGDADGIEVVGVAAAGDDVILAGLAEVARAQYDWTRKAFGLG